MAERSSGACRNREAGISMAVRKGDRLLHKHEEVKGTAQTDVFPNETVAVILEDGSTTIWPLGDIVVMMSSDDPAGRSNPKKDKRQ